MPVAVWEEDFTGVGAWLSSLRVAGVTDLRRYLEDHPDEVARGTGLIRVIDVNPAAVALVGAPSREHLLGGIPDETVTAETRASLVEQFCAVWDGSRQTSVDVDGSAIDGKRIACRLQWAAPLVAGQVDLSRVVVTLTDLTARKEAEEELERRVRFENLIAQLSTHFINLAPRDVDHGITEALAVIGEFTGADRSYLFRFSEGGSRMSNTNEWCAPGVPPMRERIQGAPTDAFPWINRQLLAGHAVHVPRVEDLPPSAAAERSEFAAQGIQSLVTVPMISSGSVMGFIGFDSVGSEESWSGHDIRLLALVGEMFVHALERKENDERLAALLESKDRLVASVSHELRTPLTAVLGFAEEVAERHRSMSPEEIEEYLNIIVEQSRELGHIVEDLLVAARIETGQLRVGAQEVDLRGEANRTLAGPGARTASIPVTGDPVAALADPQRVRQILRNLVENALRYGGRRVRVEVAQRGPVAAIMVADDGPGIPAEEQARIFEPYHSEAQGVAVPAAVGIGLTVSRHLAELMGGHLRYEHRDGESVFELTLPAATSSPPPAPPPNRRKPARVGARVSPTAL